MSIRGRSLLVRLFGFPATLLHGDTLVLDRWLWLRRLLPHIAPGSRKLLDVGCGSGAFTIGAARRGYDSLGLSWDRLNMEVARLRAGLCRTSLARFEVQDVRRLDARTELAGCFDLIVCCEVIEHILDDRKLMSDIARCLKPGGTLLLTTPNIDYRPITRTDAGPFSQVEDGWHVRKGYSCADLAALCADAGLEPLQTAFCSGFASQKITALMRFGHDIHPLLGWLLVLPLRPLPPLIDPWLTPLLRWPGFSVTLVARKP